MYIIKRNGVVVSRNARQLKIGIGKGKHSDGVYDFVIPNGKNKGEVAFQVEYKTGANKRVSGIQTSERIGRRAKTKKKLQFYSVPRREELRARARTIEKKQKEALKKEATNE